MEIKKKLLIILIMLTTMFIGCINTKGTSQEQEDTSQEQQLLLSGISLTKDIISSVYRGEDKYTYEALLYALAGNVDENNLYKGYFPFDEDKGFIFPLDKSNEVLIQVFGEKEYSFEDVFDYDKESNIYYKNLDFGWNTAYIAENVTANISDDKLKLYTRFELINLWYNVGGDPVPTAIAECEITYCINKSNDKIYFQFENIEVVSKIEDKKENNNVITVWEDKNFEALIRFYLNNFDKDIYIKDLDNVTELSIRSNRKIKTNIKECEVPEEYQNNIGLITSMKDIDNFNNLNEITIYNNEINSIYTYKNNLNISLLDLGSNKLQNLSGIENYGNLTNLDISDNYIEDLKPLNNLSKLRTLNLSYIGPTANNGDRAYISNIDINTISELTNLESLIIQNSNVSNISTLNKCNYLKSLDLFKCNLDINELYLISDNNENRIEKLAFVISNVSGEPEVLDMSKFKNLNNLRYLYVIGELTNINSLINLNSLDMINNFISKSESFSNLKNIEWLKILNSKFEDPKVLEDLNKLETVYFSDTDISSLKYLKNNKNLKSLWIVNGNLSDISDLKEFTNLENIMLPINNITDISVLSELHNLKRINISDNPINDYTVIDNLINKEEIQIIK